MIAFRNYRYEQIDREVPARGRAKWARMDLGMALLELARKPGEVFTHDDIAAWAGCSEMALRRIERRALRKLRGALGRRKIPKLEAA